MRSHLSHCSLDLITSLHWRRFGEQQKHIVMHMMLDRCGRADQIPFPWDGCNLTVEKIALGLEGEAKWETCMALFMQSVKTLI